MTKRALMVFTIVIFTITAMGIAVLVFLPGDFFHPGGREQPKTRIIIPQSEGNFDTVVSAERLAYEDSMNAKIALDEGEALVSVLPLDFNKENTEKEEQIIAYRNLLEIESPVYITYVTYDQAARTYRRTWNAPAAATRPGTVNLYTQDLIGDRSICILVTGMNGAGEHTMTVFRRNPAGDDPAFNKIAEIRIEGSISVQERERSQAYQLGQTRGQSFAIAAYGRDYESSNILDQVEITYVYNPVNGLYEQSKIARVPGTQIEQRRVRELLGGGSAEFEQFVNGLWYYVSPEGTMDTRQYLYFDPQNRELIFYSDDTQEIYSWKSSSPTRYGLYVSSQNISIANLRRFINIELESLESIQVRVFEDVHLRIGVTGSWNGSYRRVKNVETPKDNADSSAFIRPRFAAEYSGSIGKIAFYEDGSYLLTNGESEQRGKYTFFAIDNRQLLELRRGDLQNGGQRETFRVETANRRPGPGPALYENLTLFRVRLGTKGLQEMHETTISLALTGINSSS
ncbi:MAG: pallilysin-related adhesin [Treponema sp.]|nr:pallilysin-related adhesin [Treponema sp.]